MNNLELTTAVVVGVGSHYPESEFASLLNNTTEALAIDRKLARYFCPGTQAAIIAMDAAIKEANIDWGERPQNVGLFGSQSGYLSPSIEEFAPVFEPDHPFDSYADVWNCEALNPFMVTRALNNNVTGISGIYFDLNGDAASFIRDQFGSHGALQEALFSLGYGSCDVAVVPVSGSSDEILNTYLDTTSSETIDIQANQRFGGVSLVITSDAYAQAHQLAVKARLTQLSAGYAIESLYQAIQQVSEADDISMVCCYVANAELRDGVLSALEKLNADAFLDVSAYSDANICPGISTLACCAIHQLQQREAANALVLDVDSSGFYSLFRIQNEQI